MISYVSKIVPFWHESYALFETWLNNHFLNLSSRRLKEILLIHCAGLIESINENRIESLTSPLALFRASLNGLATIKGKDLILLVIHDLGELNDAINPRKISNLYEASFLTRASALARGASTLMATVSTKLMTATWAITDEFSLYSIFKGDSSSWSFLLEVDILQIMTSLRAKSFSMMKKESHNVLSKLDLMGHIYLPGFNPLNHLLFELKEEFGDRCQFSVSYSKERVVIAVQSTSKNSDTLKEEILSSLGPGIIS